MRASLVVSQVALTVVLLTGAGLLIKSLVRLQQAPLGFRPERLLTARLTLPSSAYSRAQRRDYADRLLEELRRQRGMEESAVTSFLPFATGIESFASLMPGQETFWGGMPIAHFRSVSLDYFRVMSIPLVKGRGFSGADQERSAKVTIINETMARRYWPNADPLGQRIQETSGEGAWREIVGVVGSVRHQAREQEPRPEMFVPWRQRPGETLNLVVRTEAKATDFGPALRRAVARIDRNLPVFEVRAMEERLFDAVAAPRFRAALLGVFAALALIMAVIGHYAVMAVTVAQRTHEVGIRLALGAQRQDVIGLVVEQGLRLVLIGIVLGLAGAAVLTRVLTALLYEVTPTDPFTFLAVPGLLLAVTALSSYLPARRAARVDPMVALRYE
jgi:putative ABC transport system permease protein